ncbi:TetR/AcrR family transcriptional regulator [Hyphomonas oceanitis]|uniref:TetR/AcrR family transcriptional regulator n=1 Tax=Hyphomonas oceanitis TaxID=81033 RepID=UPI00300315CC
MQSTEIGTARDIQKKSAYHHGDLRNSIIEAVSQLIDQRKSLDFQLKDVASLVGTSTPAIYRHFASKQDLLVETAVAGYKFQKAFRAHALDQCATSPLARLLSIGYAYVHFAKECPGFYLLMKNLETDEILSSEKYQEERDEGLSLVRSLVKECIDTGLFIEIDTDLAMASLQATAFGLAHLYLGSQAAYIPPTLLGDRDLVAKIFTINVRSLLSEQGQQKIADASQNPFT